MNRCALSGWIQGEPEVRTTRDQRRILNFEIAVEGDGPYVPVSFILHGEGVPDLHAGIKVHIRGGLKHHRVRGLFIAAASIHALDSDGVTETTERLTQ